MGLEKIIELAIKLDFSPKRRESWVDEQDKKLRDQEREESRTKKT